LTGTAEAIRPGLRQDAAVEESRFPFELSGRAGEAVVSYGRNDDPARWGYDLLGLDFPWEVARGFPVLRADISYAADGYAAVLGWMQVVSMSVAGEAEARAMVDVPPQLIGSGFPYACFGVEPTMFDAPSTTHRDVVWVARTFLTASPDRLMTKVVAPVIGFRWGYTIKSGQVTVDGLAPASGDDWAVARAVIGAQYSDWEFLGAFEQHS
jgi:hypothetical protein